MADNFLLYNSVQVCSCIDLSKSFVLWQISSRQLSQHFLRSVGRFVVLSFTYIGFFSDIKRVQFQTGIFFCSLFPGFFLWCHVCWQNLWAAFSWRAGWAHWRHWIFFIIIKYDYINTVWGTLKIKIIRNRYEKSIKGQPWWPSTHRAGGHCVQAGCERSTFSHCYQIPANISWPVLRKKLWPIQKNCWLSIKKNYLHSILKG